MAEISQGAPMTIVVVGSINTDLTIQVPHFAVANETVLGHGDFTTTQGGKGAKQVALTLGGLGCCISTDDETTFIQAKPVQAIDTTGAGDAFNGFLATALVKGLAAAKAAEVASAAATLSVTRAGARANLPTWDEVQAFLGA